MRISSHIVLVVALSITMVAFARPRPLKEVATPDGRYSLRLTPGRPMVTRALPCRAFLMHRGDDGRREKRWDRTLVNDVAPEQAFIHPGGDYLVTMNEYERGGGRHALVVYGGAGSLLRHFLLTDLLTKDDWEHVKVEGNAVRWLKGATMRFDVSREHFVIELAWKRTIRIDLARGRVFSEFDPPKLPDAIARQLFPRVDEIVPDLTQPPISEELEALATAEQKVDPPVEPNTPEPVVATAEQPAQEAPGVPADPTYPPTPDPADPADYIAWMNRLVVGKGSAAAPFLKSASEQLLDWEAVSSIWRDALKGDSEALNSPELRKWLSSNENAIADFRMAAMQPNPGLRYKYGSEPPMIGMVLPQLSNLRLLARAAVLQGNVLAEVGQHDEAASVYLDAATVGSQIGRGATLIESLVGVAVQQMAYEAMLRQAAQAPVGYDPDLVAAGMAETALELRPFPELVQSEQAMVLDALQYIFEYDADEEIYRANPDRVSLLIDESGSGADTDPAEAAEEFTRLGFENMVGEIREYYKTMTAIAQLSYPDARTYMNELERVTTRDDFNPLMRMLLPSFEGYAQVRARSESTRNGTELALNLLAYRKEHGELPESLHVFSDESYVIDPLTNQRFVYRRDGENFTLYSLGLDNEDDGGVHNPKAEEEDYVIWPPQE